MSGPGRKVSRREIESREDAIEDSIDRSKLIRVRWKANAVTLFVGLDINQSKV